MFLKLINVPCSSTRGTPEWNGTQGGQSALDFVGILLLFQDAWLSF